jgi:hypothetical protein
MNTECRWQPHMLWKIRPVVANFRSRAQKWTGNIMRYEVQAPVHPRLAHKVKPSTSSTYSCRCVRVNAHVYMCMCLSE